MNDEFKYIKDSFTKTEDKINLEVDNLNVSCITSKNSNFNLDSEGNMTVNSISSATGLLSYQSILDFIYPIGSIYMSVNDNNPNITFGGSWERWASGRTLLGVDAQQEEFNISEKIGGNKEVVLSLSEMPKHTHLFSGVELGSHTHGASGTTNGGDHKHNFAYVESSKVTSSGTWSVLRPYGYGGNGTVAGGDDNSSNHFHQLSINVQQASIGVPNGINSEVGGNSPHTNMQPYITCYIWKRVA